MPFSSSRRVPARVARSGNTLRPVEWIRACYGLANLPVNTVELRTLVSPADFDDFTQPTVVRIRGDVFVLFGDVTLGLNAQVIMGITIINPGEPAPDPFSQSRGNRWLWWNCASFVATDPPEYGVSAWRIPFDVKSMRKRQVDGSQLVFVVTQVDPAASPGAYSVGSSTLVKE